MDDLAAQLAAKYGGKKSKQPNFDEPSEEEFLKARERMEARMKNSSAPPKRKR